MATISPEFTKTTIRGQTVTTVLWEAVATGDTLNAFGLIDTAAVAGSVQISGTFGGATVTLQVSNDGTTWFDAKDLSGNTMDATSNSYFEFTSAALYMRPAIASGSGNDVDIILSLRG